MMVLTGSSDEFKIIVLDDYSEIKITVIELEGNENTIANKQRIAIN